jgi:histone-lysine N-methyltransferase SETMAR
MDQHSICLFLAMKGLSAQKIHSELVAVLGADAIGYSTITRYLRQQHFPTKSSEPPENTSITVVGNAILDALKQQPFSSIREIAKLTCIPRTTVHRHLTSSLGFVVKHLHWVPHELTANQKSLRASLSKQLLREVQSIQHQGWQFIITLDESWFYFATSHELIWLRAGEAPPERPKHMIGDKKIMVTIAWNPLGFHLVDVLPKGMLFNAEYYRDNILAPLLRLRPDPENRYLVIHADNARPHTAKKCQNFWLQNRLRLAQHPPYSPDLAPSDFFLFGHLKQCLQGKIFQSQEELLTGIMKELPDINSETLESVFAHWMERLEWVSENNGDYYP